MAHDTITSSFYVVALNGPSCDWYQNIVSIPRVQVQVGGQQFEATAEPVNPDEARAAFQTYGCDLSGAFNHVGDALDVELLDEPDALAQALPIVRLRTTVPTEEPEPAEPLMSELLNTTPMAFACNATPALAPGTQA